MPFHFSFSPELGYVAVLFALFVLPRALQRYSVPAAITSLALGAISGLWFGLFQHDTTIHLLSAFGIVALFLFAGLEVEVGELRANAVILIQHLVVRALLLTALALGVGRLLHLDGRVAALVALALLTPSTGFILDTIGHLDLGPVEKRWIKAKAIATELLALLVLFSVLQSTTVERMAISLAVLTAMILVLPLVFRAFVALVVPFAPKSEFGFLVMIAVICAFVTRELGVYYLVGAFVVGMTAQRFRERLPAIASEQILHAVEMFASFFVPFYFFNAGLGLRREDFEIRSIAFGIGCLAVMVPVRVAAVIVHRRMALREDHSIGLRVAVAMLPTLVFGLVIAEILRDRFAAPPWLFGGVILYTLLTTILPVFYLRRPLPEFLEPHAPALGTVTGGAPADAALPGTAAGRSAVRGAGPAVEPIGPDDDPEAAG
jgi:Kef-type K+ transport system membrane component KefB